MYKIVKKLLLEILSKKSGRRFFFAYLKINRLINRNLMVKILFFVTGLVFFLLGVVMLFMPGPGVLFLIVGGLLLCVVSKKIARFFDIVEIHGRKFTDRYRSVKK